jgi:hypothetical protein
VKVAAGPQLACFMSGNTVRRRFALRPLQFDPRILALLVHLRSMTNDIKSSSHRILERLAVREVAEAVAHEALSFNDWQLQTLQIQESPLISWIRNCYI